MRTVVMVLVSRFLVAAGALPLILTTAGAWADLPAPVDVPVGPAKVEPPGNAALPSMVGRVAAEAPAISMISDCTLPGETLVVTGHGLEGSHLRIWSGERLMDVNPLRTAADRMQAVVPKECLVSTMLVWPVKDGLTGAPIRVNGATAWWAWPARVDAQSAGQTIRGFGKNLKLDGHSPRVYLRGPGVDEWLTVLDSNSYHVEAALPDNLEQGTYQVWYHNGTGGRLGWSEPVRFDVVAMPSRDGLPTFHADRFGARADDGRDDWQGISGAIDAAEAAGGGVVRLGPGCYRLSRPLNIDNGGPKGVHFCGAGMGEHRWRNEPVPNDHKVIHEISGTATVLRPTPGLPCPAELMKISRRYSSLRNVTLLNHADSGKQRCLSVCAHDVVVEHVRGVVVDERPRFEGWDKPENEITIAECKSRLQDEAVLRIDAPGEANIVIRECEFHHPGAGIDTPPIRNHIGHSRTSRVCPKGTDCIRIADCTFRGYFDGRLEPVDRARRFQAYRGWHNAAWYNNNSKKVIVERCDFAGADKHNFKVMTRALNHGNTSIRELYLANNTGHDLAPTSMTPGYHENKGEQIIFHLWYPQGGLFDVTSADMDSVMIDVTDPKYAPTGKRHPGVTLDGPAFSVVPKDVDVNPTHWVVFVCAGRGVGQYRVVRACERRDREVVLRLEKPWRVTPDRTSRLMLNAAFRRIIIHGNRLDAGPHVDPAIKSHGVVFWANAFDNIIADNTFRSFTGGVVINAFYRCPTAWNLTRNNRIENIHGNGGDTVFPGRAAFYVDHIRVRKPRPEDRVWYGVGNIARGNRCIGGDVAAYLHRPDYARVELGNPDLPEATRKLLLMPRGDNTVVGYSYPRTPNGGLMMSVLENNRFESVREGIVVSSPLNWLLLRNNEIRLVSPNAPEVIDESRGAHDGDQTARELLVIDESEDTHSGGRH